MGLINALRYLLPLLLWIYQVYKKYLIYKRNMAYKNTITYMVSCEIVHYLMNMRHKYGDAS